MNGSSIIEESVFEGVTPRRVFNLIEVLKNQKRHTEMHVRSIYLQNSENFDPNLEFLTRLGVVDGLDGKLKLHEKPPNQFGSIFFVWLTNQILIMPNPYRSEIFYYIKNYQLEQGKAVYRSTIQSRSLESHVRNFLMDLGIVKYDRIADWHAIGCDYLFLYGLSIEKNRVISPENLKASLLSKEKIGLDAEKAVMKYEANRLGVKFANHLEHVSLRNSAAGYDILSISMNENEGSTPRYIEVKAVSPESMCFYWTHNEIAVAKILREYYFLYLLPIYEHGSCDTTNLQIIPDPTTSIFQNPEHWNIQEDVVRCWQKCN